MTLVTRALPWITGDTCVVVVLYVALRHDELRDSSWTSTGMDPWTLLSSKQPARKSHSC
mgnify:CR=1 FL=1